VDEMPSPNWQNQSSVSLGLSSTLKNQKEL
jgi:hypothetical protein